MKAMTLPASSAEPPPSAITPSWRPAFSAASPASTFAATGLGFTSQNTAAAMLSPRSTSSARLTGGSSASRGSVTSSGRDMPAAFTAAPSSAMRPAPKRTEVG